MGNDDDLDKDDDKMDKLHDSFNLLLEVEILDEFYPSPEGFEQVFSPCCTGELIIMFNSETNMYSCLCEECNAEILRFKKVQFILNISDLELIKE